MTTKRITDLIEKVDEPSINDLLIIQDTLDNTDSPTGTDKKIKYDTLRGHVEDYIVTGLDLDTRFDGKVDTVVGKGLSEEDFTTALKDKLDGIETGAEVNAVTSVNTQTGVVVLDKGDVGLGNVDDTSDANKPISNATQTALDLKADASDLSDYEKVLTAISPLSIDRTDPDAPAISVTTTTSNVDTTGGRIRRNGDFGSPITFIGDTLFSSDFNTVVANEISVTTTGVWQNGPLGDTTHVGVLYQTAPRAFNDVMLQTWVEQRSTLQPVRMFWRVIQTNLTPENWGPWCEALHENNVKTIGGESILGSGDISIASDYLPTLSPALTHSVTLIGSIMVSVAATSPVNSNNYGIRNYSQQNNNQGRYTGAVILNSGEIRITAEHSAEFSNRFATLVIYKNGTQLTSFTHQGVSMTLRTLDVEVEAGDYISISHYLDSGGESRIRNVKISSDSPTMVLI